jgi:hypothetical protein
LDFFFIQIEKFVRGHPIIVDVHFGFNQLYYFLERQY